MARGGVRQGAGRRELSGPYREKTKPVRLPLSMVETIQEFLKGGNNVPSTTVPFFESTVSAGTPFPADDRHDSVNLHNHLIQNPQQTFLVKATGDSMIGAGIHHDDFLVVDQSLMAKADDIVVAVVEGDVTVKRYHPTAEGLILRPENPDHTAIMITPETNYQLWGVVTNVIHKFR